MKQLSDKIHDALLESENGIYEGIIFRYEIYTAGASGTRAIRRTNKMTKSCRLYNINGRLVL